MTNLSIKTILEPSDLKAYSRNEALLLIEISNQNEQVLWCESEIKVTSPLSLAFDYELNRGFVRIGMMEPNKTKKKKVNLYTRPNNFPDDYKLNILFFIYDKDGVIFERIEHQVIVPCKENKKEEEKRNKDI